MIQRRPALGKGLDALIPAPPAPRTGVLSVGIELLSPNQEQPRRGMHEGKLEELARSIKANGIIQPILVRRTGETYRIIAGERRWRAAQRAGLHEVPVVERDVPEGTGQNLLELALIENIQREDLSPVEEARGYQRLAEEFGLSHDQIASAVGKDRSSIANFIRLLKLPEEVLNNLEAGELSMGHARALLALPDGAAQRRAAREIIVRGLSVREAEALAKKQLAPAGAANKSKGVSPQPDIHTRAAEDRIRFALGARVRIVRRGQGGTIEISFSSEAELDRVYEVLAVSR